MKAQLLFGLILLVFFSCGKEQATIDGTDQIGFNQSVEKVAKDLPALQQRKLKEAINLVYEYKTNPSQGNRWEKVRTMLDQNTADDLFTLAESIAKEEGFTWNRNQAAITNGIPGKTKQQEETKKEEPVVKSPIADAVSMDLIAELEGKSIHIYPSFYTQNGKAVRFEKVVDNILVEVFSNQRLVKSFKGKLTDYRDTNFEMGGDGIVLPLNNLDPSKIENSNIQIKVRAPHPENYLQKTQRLKIPSEFVGFVEKKDTLQAANKDTIQKPKQDLAKVVSVSLVKRFLNAVKNNNLALAYGFTKSSQWSGYKTFSGKSTGVGALKNLTINQVRFMHKTNDAHTQVKASVDYSGKKDQQFGFDLQKINGKWFITKLVQPPVEVQESNVPNPKPEPIPMQPTVE